MVRVQDGDVRIVEALVADSGGHGQLRADEPLVLDEEGELLLRERGGARLVRGAATQSAELEELRPFPGQEVRELVSGEDVDAAPVALEDLADRGLVVLGAPFDDVVPEQERGRIPDGAAFRGGEDRQEARASEAEAAVADFRLVDAHGRPRRLLDHVLTVQVVQQARAPLAAPGADIGVRLQAFDAVVVAGLVLRRGGPVIPLVLGVVHPPHQAVRARDLVVQPAEEDAAVLRLRVGRVGSEGWIRRRDARVEQHRIDRDPDVLLLLVVGAEEEEVVAQDRAADGAAVLLLLLVRRFPAVRQLRDRAVRLPVVEAGSVQVVRPALRDDVDDTAARRPELDRRAVADDGELLDRLLRDRERRPAFRGAEGAAEEPVVVVQPVDGRVRVDPALARDEDRAAVFGVAAGLRRQQDQILEVPAVDRQRLELFRLDGRGRRRIRHLDGRRGRRHRDRLLDRRELQAEIHGRDRPDVEPDVGMDRRPEAGQGRRQRVEAGWKVDDLIEAVVARDGRLDQSGSLVPRLHRGAGQRLSVRGLDGAGDAAGGDVGLRGRRGRDAEREKRDEHRDRSGAARGQRSSHGSLLIRSIQTCKSFLHDGKYRQEIYPKFLARC